jgi:hypothetical protein
MGLCWSLRSPHVSRHSITHELVNVPGRLIATALVTRAPGRKIAAARSPQFIPQATGSGAMKLPCKSRPRRASMRGAPAFGNASAIFSRTKNLAANFVLTNQHFIAMNFTRIYKALF